MEYSGPCEPVNFSVQEKLVLTVVSWFKTASYSLPSPSEEND